MSTLRLQVVLQRAGIASRRGAEEYIQNGRVAVNGSVVTKMGTKVDPEADRITVDGQPIGEQQEKTTILLNKPAACVTTLSDPEGRATVLELVQDEPFSFFPVGRLDYHSEGLLLLTTDGELANRLLHPRYHVPKIYYAKVAGRLEQRTLQALQKGVRLSDGMTRPTVVEIIRSSERDTRSTWIEIVVTEGRNRLIRRMCEAVGHIALRVIRTELAGLALSDLRPGQYRYLGQQDLSKLYRAAGLKEAPPLSERAMTVGTKPLGTAQRRKGPLPNEKRKPAVSKPIKPTKPRKTFRPRRSPRSTPRGRPRRRR